MTVEQKEIKFISDIFEKINEDFGFDSIFQLIYDNLKNFIPYNRIGIGIVNEKTNEVYSIANRSDTQVFLDIGYTLSLEKHP